MSSNDPPSHHHRKISVPHFLSPNVLLNRVGKFAHNVVGGATTGATTSAGADGGTAALTGGKEASRDIPASTVAKHRHLRNIFATPLSIVHHVVAGVGTVGVGAVSDGKKKPTLTLANRLALPSFKHHKMELEFLVNHLKDHYLFESLADHELHRVAGAFELVTLPKQLNLVEVDSSILSLPNAGDTVIIQQDEWVTDTSAYFYVLYKGRCQYEIDNEVVGDQAIPGDSFGELALLYNCPRAATVRALTSLSDVLLFRIHQTGFRLVLQNQNSTSINSFDSDDADREKIKLLDGVSFLRQSSTPEDMAKLAHAMKPRIYDKGEFISKYGETGTDWYIIQRGTVTIDVTSHANKPATATTPTGMYSDIHLTAGDCFGEGAILTNVPHHFDIIADSADTLIFSIDKDTFTSVVKDLQAAVVQSVDSKKLKGIAIVNDTIVNNDNNRRVLNYLVSKIKNYTYKKGTILCQQGQKIQFPALYLIRTGQVSISRNNGSQVDIVSDHGFFGDDQLLFDARPGSVAAYTATVVSDVLTVGILTLEVCRKIMNTKRMGQDQKLNFDSLRISEGSNEGDASVDKITMKDLKLYTILGAGTFGQVWLVSRDGTDGTKHAYALKIQSKYELVKNGQARGVVHEKQIMEQLHHPFVGGLVSSFHDDTFLYMILPLVQGGELYSVMPQNNTNAIDRLTPEPKAVFYIAAIAEGLTYMHRRGFVFRDLKPENVLIDAQGYPVIIDFGFAKYVLDKTFTLCGTPLYIAPEVILNRGHNYGADHWSLGCLIYEMLTGRTPFYEGGMDQSALFKAIVKGVFPMARGISNDAQSILLGLLTRNPNRRLGCPATHGGNGNFDDILYHPWLCTIDHEALLLKDIPAPSVPKIKDPFDRSNFDDWSHVEDKRKVTYPKLKQSQELLFEGF